MLCLVRKLCWPHFCWVSQNINLCIQFSFHPKIVPWGKKTTTPKPKARKQRSNRKTVQFLSRFTETEKLKSCTNKQICKMQISAWKHLWHSRCETAASEGAAKPFASDTLPLSLRESEYKPLTLQMSTLHHCENWCFWAVQSRVEHIRVQAITAQRSTERQAHPPLEGSNLYHLTLKDLWV